jgi:hypothetical protein
MSASRLKPVFLYLSANVAKGPLAEFRTSKRERLLSPPGPARNGTPTKGRWGYRVNGDRQIEMLSLHDLYPHLYPPRAARNRSIDTRTMGVMSMTWASVNEG